MTTTPRGQPSADPGADGARNNGSPEKPELPRCIVGFRGFHLHREKPKVTDWIVVGLTLIVAFAAIVSAWLFQGQLTEMRRQTKQSLESFRIDERAWVEIQAIHPIFFAPRDEKFGAVFRYELRPKNFGKTVARDIVIKAQESQTGEEFSSMAGRILAR